MFLYEGVNVSDGTFFFTFSQDSLFPEIRVNAANPILKPSAQKLAFVSNAVPVTNMLQYNLQLCELVAVYP